MNLRSSICRGAVTHERLHPIAHAFTYPSTFFALDLSELDAIAAHVPIFSHNGKNLLRLNDKDYLHGAETDILGQLDKLIAPEKNGERTVLISSPRYFGYAFNPVNFHLRMNGGRLLCVVAEVNNTFGDRHVYPLKELMHTAANTWTARCSKAFHVSPFNNMEGDYCFTFKISDKHLFMGVDLYREGNCILKTWLEGNRRPITTATIFRYALLHPFDTALNSLPRILWQAALLHYKKHLHVYTRPSPVSEDTLIDRDEKDRPTQVV